MEPIEWGLAAIAVLMGKKACETVSESLTKEVFDATYVPAFESGIRQPVRRVAG
ncbi:hypothetical protein [Lyngbya sp. CCY1209]|uniref:hypothetical protein n=1 Tax=Lyngbya sp. CCY1209 TaxID=2886103 RepID=UPI002D210B6E|nr:hypothetical protein [Lyngbya sp. CCY1209]MEB3885426.1 hypothetical protein [Lyngbya sp. CCY1209]